MSLPLLLSLVALAFVALLALLWSRWPGWLKGLLVLSLTVFYFFAAEAVSQLAGWPTAESLPEQFLLLAAVIEEPNSKRLGGLQLWVQPLEEGKPTAQARAYSLPYRKDLHALLNESLKKTREGVAQVGSTTLKQGKGGLAWLRPSGSEQQVKLRDLPVPQLPEK